MTWGREPDKKADVQDVCPEGSQHRQRSDFFHTLAGKKNIMKILLVEDEPKVIEFLKKGLEEQGYETEVAFDGQMGERLALSGKMDLIIVDVILPYINGYELCRRIRDKGLQVPVLMLTALGTTNDKLAGFDAGADDYLVKPFEFAELLARIKALSRRTSGFISASSPA